MRNHKKLRQQGFTLLEMFAAGLVLLVGLVGMAGVLAFGIKTTQTSQENMIAKQLADEAMQSIFAARDGSQVQWLQIQNVGSGTNPDGIFVTGFQAINQPGADGIYGTADDAVAGPETLVLPGPDGIPGDADDRTMALTSYQRQIAITNVAGEPALRLITITIQYYSVPQFGTTKTYVLQAYISQFH